MKKSVVMKIVDRLGNAEYLTVGPQGVSLQSRSQTPLALANVVDKDAFLCEFELKKARTAKEALAVARRHVYRHMTVEIMK